VSYKPSTFAQRNEKQNEEQAYVLVCMICVQLPPHDAVKKTHKKQHIKSEDAINK